MIRTKMLPSANIPPLLAAKMQPSANIRLLLPVIDSQHLKAHQRRKLLLDSMKCLCLRNFKNHLACGVKFPNSVIRKMQLKSCSQNSWHKVGFIARRRVLSCFALFLEAFVPWNVWNLLAPANPSVWLHGWWLVMVCDCVDETLPLASQYCVPTSFNLVAW